MNLDLALIIKGDASGAKQAIEQARASVEDLGKAAEQSSAKTTDVWGRTAEEVKKAGEATKLASEKTGAALGQTVADAKEMGAAGAASTGQVVDGLDEISTAAPRAAAEIGNIAGRALVTGRVTTAELGRIVGVLVRIGGAAGVAIAAIGAAGKLYNDYLVSTKARDTAASGLGRASAGTFGELEAAAQAGAAAGNVSISTARAMETQFLRTGKIGQEAFAGLIAVAKDYAATIGTDVKGATTQLSDLFADPARGAEVLYRNLGLIDEATARYVIQLARQNDVTGAQKVLLEALPERLANAERSLTLLGRGWDYVSTKASNAGGHIGHFIDGLIYNPSLDEQLNTLNDRIEQLRHLRDNAERLYGNGTMQRQTADGVTANLPALESERDRIAALLDLEKKRSDIERRDAQRRAAGATALGIADQSPSTGSARRERELRDQIKALQAGANAPGLSDEARGDIATTIAAKSRALDGLIDREQRLADIQRLDIRIQNERNPLVRADLAASREKLAVRGEEISTATADARVQRARQAIIDQVTESSRAQVGQMSTETEARAHVTDAVMAGTLAAGDAEAAYRREIELRPLMEAAARAEGDEKLRLTNIIKGLSNAYSAEAAELKRASAATYIQGQQDRLEMTRAEIGLLGKSEMARGRVLSQLQVEQEIRRRGLPLDGEEARLMRENAAEQAKLNDARSWYEINEAQRQRLRSMNDTLASSRLDIALIGKTAGEVAAVQFAFQQLQQVRDEAIRLGITGEEEFQKVFGREIDQIAEASARLREYTDAAARVRLRNDLQFERDQLGRTSLEQTVADRLRGAGLEVDLGSRTAAEIRINEILKQRVGIWNDIRDTGMDAIDQLVGSASRGFSDIGDVFEGIASDFTRQIFQLSLANPLKNSMFNAGLPTIGDVGGTGGFLSTMLGLTSNPAAGLGELGTMANPMYVMQVGGIGGGDNLVSRLFAPANSNTASGGSISERVWNFFSNKGLADHQVAGILGNIGAESSFNPSATNPASGAYGIFQHLGSRLTGLGSGSDLTRQLEYAWQELQGPESRTLKNLLASTDVRSATGAFAGFERAEGFSWSNPEGIALWEKRLSGANAALDKFGGVTGAAGRSATEFGQGLKAGLGEFGDGLGNLWNKIGTFLQSPAGGGSSWFQGLSSAFGGAGGAFGHMLSISPAATMDIMSGSWGAFDVGGPTGGNDPRKVAGLVHEEEYVMDAPVVRAVGVPFLDKFRQAAKSGRGFAVGGYGGGPLRSGDANGRGPSGTVVNIFDQREAGSPAVERQERVDENGQQNLDIYIRRTTQDEVNRPSATTNRQLRGTYGLSNQVVRR